MTSATSIRDLIANIRQGRGLTQAELAKALGVKQAAVSQYERGVIKMGVSPLIKLLNLADKSQQNFILVELRALCGFDEADVAGPSELAVKWKCEREALEAEQAAIDADKATLDAKERALDAQLAALEKLDHPACPEALPAIRGRILVALGANFGEKMTIVGNLTRCVDPPMCQADYVGSLEHMARSGYISLIRVSVARELIRAAGFPDEEDFAKGFDPEHIAFVKLLPRGLDLLNKAIPPDPEVAV